MPEASPRSRGAAAELAAAVRISSDFERARAYLLCRAVAAEPASAAWDGDLAAAWGALPRVRQESITDGTDLELEEIVDLSCWRVLAAAEPLNLEATADRVLGVVAVEISRRELERQGVRELTARTPERGTHVT